MNFSTASKGVFKGRGRPRKDAANTDDLIHHIDDYDKIDDEDLPD